MLFNNMGTISRRFKYRPQSHRANALRSISFLCSMKRLWWIMRCSASNYTILRAQMYFFRESGGFKATFIWRNFPSNFDGIQAASTDNYHPKNHEDENEKYMHIDLSILDQFTWSSRPQQYISVPRISTQVLRGDRPELRDLLITLGSGRFP